MAEEKQLGAVEDYTQIVAPFTGVITRCYVDTDALAQAVLGFETAAMP